jgi:hypothetical protein
LTNVARRRVAGRVCIRIVRRRWWR